MDMPSLGSRSTSPYSSSDDESSFATANTHRSSSDDSIDFYSPKSPKRDLQVRRPDTVTNIADLLQADTSGAEIATRLNATPRSMTQWSSIGMSEEAFIKRANELGLSPEEAGKLASDVREFVQTLCDSRPTEGVHHAEQLLRNAEKLPASTSVKKLVATNVVAGAAGYLTSFFLGKLFANLLGLGVGTQGGWIFPIAGLLNVLVSEPVGGAIRMQGAFHPSADGAAYTDYNTACARLEKAESLQDADGIQRWTKEVAKIVDGVINREQAKPGMWFCSGIKKPTRDADGFALDRQGERDPHFAKEAEKVIAGARKRSFVTDELPFNFYTVNYFASGALAPLFRAQHSPAVASAIDVGLSAALGMLSGAETALMQDYLRKEIQNVPLRSLTENIKYAKVAVAAAKRDALVDPMNKAKACEAVLKERLLTQQVAAGEGNILSQESIKKTASDLAFAKDVRRTIAREHHKAKRHHEAHTAGRHRFSTEVGAFVNAYLGEKSDPPRPLQGRRAINRVIAKTIATPLALAFTPLYTSVVVPAILGAVASMNAPFSTVNPNGTESNFTAPGDVTDFMSNSTAMPDRQTEAGFTLPALSMGLSAAFSLPLILGYMARNQLIAPVIERGITYLETVCFGKTMDSDSENDTNTNEADDSEASIVVGLPDSDDDSTSGDDSNSVVVQVSGTTEDDSDAESVFVQVDGTNQDDDRSMSSSSVT